METNSTIEDGDQGHFWNSNVFDRFRSDLLQSSMKLETVLRFFKCHCSALIMCKVVLNVYQVGFLALRNYQSFDSSFTISNRAGFMGALVSDIFRHQVSFQSGSFSAEQEGSIVCLCRLHFVPPGVARSPIGQKGPFVRAALISRHATRWPARVSGRSLF